ncbi:MAG: hemolysin family protein [Rickettsiales bacterium]
MLGLLWIILALSLIILNAFFVAAEFGMVRLRKTRVEVIEETYGVRGKILARVHKDLDAYLSACQLGITLASLGLGWIGEPAFSALLMPFFDFIEIIPIPMVHFLSFFIAFSLLSFLHIVVGELMPKSLAIRQSEKVSVWTALPLYGFYWIMFPAIWLLNTCSNFLLRLFKLHKIHKGENFYSSEEIKLILNASHLHGELKKAERDILEHTLDFADLQVTDVMRPIDEMVSLDINQPVDQLLKTVMETRYSRYPITNGINQTIIGIAHVKDLFSVLYEHKQISSLREIIRPILKAPAHLPALDLLRKFRGGMPHFAVIYQQAESPIGFITLDNLLHILVGRIKDEFHKTKDDWIELPDGGYLMKGNNPLYSVERALNIDIYAEDNVTTLYGLITNKLGGLPKKGDTIEFDEFIAIIQKMYGTKISEVKIYPKNNPTKE